MSFLFGRARGRAAADLPKQAHDHITKLDGPNGASKAEELARVLNQMKLILQGTNEADNSPEQIYQLVTGLIEEDLLYLLATNLHRLPFESRKDAQVIFSYIFRFRTTVSTTNSDPIALSYVVNSRPQVVIELCRAYDHKESATPAGSVLREILKNEAAASIILHDDGDEPGSSARGIKSIDPHSRLPLTLSPPFETFLPVTRI
ncbi:conidiophore development protein hymA [Ophiocordyceps camponoti-floridani]|uniref:Conidiophore development protein hymA n=1 Tax=Ophiocordyceps camponoti-floridani TaxID=2030778 RepID=A0A8H4Q962_9HYPO|nr:conidiophore development protein hymA [Ophiocordyceps camponoti-floridani]